MRFFAIRDDDISFYTNLETLDNLYNNLWGKIPISFAVIPFVFSNWQEKKEIDTRDHFKPIHENLELVEYLRTKIQYNEIEIMLHGYSHEYRFRNNYRIGEYAWKSKVQLLKETIEAKRYLEELFHTTIQVFVPPSNMIGKAGAIAVESAGLHISGIIGRKLDRPISYSYLKAYLRRWIYRILKGRPYPFPLTIGNHIELVAYSLTPKASLEWLQETMKVCYKLNAPFVLAVHHWELIQYPMLRQAFERLIEEALGMGYTPKSVSECILSTK